jgi:tetratricopeptide (TPR) repeat protein
MESLIIFNSKQQCFSVDLNNRDETIVYGYIDNSDYKDHYLIYKDNKTIKIISNNMVFSPDGNYYIIFQLLKEHSPMEAFDKENKFLRQIKCDYFLFKWSYDSRNIFYCNKDGLNLFDVETGQNNILFKFEPYNYGFPVTVKDANILYLLKNLNFGPGYLEGIIFRYNLKDKTLMKMNVPVSNYEIPEYSYTISPKNKVLIFLNFYDSNLYFIDFNNDKIFDEMHISNFLYPLNFSWRNDSSYVIINFGFSIVKYTLPVDYWDEEISATNQIGMQSGSNEQFNRLINEGYNFYKAHNDIEAVKKYEEAIKLGESAELYYDYANSLSNLKDRLDDSIKAYKKAIKLGYEKKELVYYNIACVYSRQSNISEAYMNLNLAVNNGYKQINYFLKDPDLVNIRADKDWKKFYEGLKK